MELEQSDELRHKNPISDENHLKIPPLEAN